MNVLAFLRLADKLNELNSTLEKECEQKGVNFDEVCVQLGVYVDSLIGNSVELFINAQPPDLRVAYAANPKLQSIADHWFANEMANQFHKRLADYGLTEVKQTDLHESFKLLICGR